jgi:MFS family permease
MALMARGDVAGIVVGQVALAFLVSAISGALPATMAELAPWRVRCTVLSISYNLGMALLGGTTPLVAAWLVSRSGYALAPAVYLAAAGALSFAAAILLPRIPDHAVGRGTHAGLVSAARVGLREPSAGRLESSPSWSLPTAERRASERNKKN